MTLSIRVEAGTDPSAFAYGGTGAMGALHGLAQLNDSDAKAAAEALFKEGMSLASKGRYAEACPKLEESQRLDASLGTEYYLADCHEHVGRTASAWAGFLEVAAKAKALGQTSKETKARRRASALEPRLSKLTVKVATPGAPGLEVSRGKVVVGLGQWGVAIPLDPGTYTLTARADGKQTWTKHVVIDPQASVTETVPALESETRVADSGIDTTTTTTTTTTASTTNADTGEAPADTRLQASSVHESSSKTQKYLGLVTVGLGVASIGVAGGFAIAARTANNRSKGDGLCDANNACTTDAFALRETALHRADFATAALVVGGALVAAGTVLWITAPSDTPTKQAFRHSLSVGVAGNFLLFSGHF
ncbi:MAG: hypothetical protein NVS3B20_22260 [Polyangiales bacterium]